MQMKIICIYLLLSILSNPIANKPYGYIYLS